MTAPNAPSVTPSPIETLREAARRIREEAQAAIVPWHPYSDTSLPLRSGVQMWSDDMRGYLGGTWGEFAASWHPVIALAVADWLDAEAATRGEMEPFAELINAAISRDGGPKSYIRFGRNESGEIAMVTDTLDAALAVAHAYLGTTADAGARPAVVPRPGLCLGCHRPIPKGYGRCPSRTCTRRTGPMCTDGCTVDCGNCKGAASVPGGEPS